jgi:hypothetical protein
VVDVTDPWNAFLVGSFPSSRVEAVEASGSYVFLGTRYHLYVVDASDPANPVEIASLPADNIHDMALEGDHLYTIQEAGSQSSLVVFDVSSPFNPIETGSALLRYEYPRDVALDYPYVYACTATPYTTMSVEIVDVSVPAYPQVVARTAGGFWDVSDIDVENGYAYVTDTIWGLNISDVSIPQSVPLLEQFPTGDRAYDVEQVGDYAFVADRSDGLTVVDLVGGQGIVEQVTSIGTVFDLDVVGNLAYVTGPDALHVLDIADPLQVWRLSTTYLPANPFDLDVEGDYVYIADTEVDLVIVDVSNPEDPEIVAEYNGPLAETRGVEAAWPYVYLGDDWHGFHIVDVTDPAYPVGRGDLDFAVEEYAYGAAVAASGNFAYMADGYSGLFVIDVSDVDQPTVAEHFPNFLTMDAVVEGSILYTARLDLGINLWDISDPGSPRLLGEVDTEGQARGIAVGPHAILVADEGEGIQLVPRHRAAAALPEEPGVNPPVVQLRLWPNPVRDHLTMQIHRSPGDRLLGEIFDLAGRAIRHLSGPGTASSGRRLIEWDCRDDRGRRVAAGTYLVRIGETEGRVVVLR